MTDYDLSIICANRVDNYEGDSLGRFIDSVEYNCRSLKTSNINYEYIVVEWSPIDQHYLYYHERTKHLFDEFNIRDVAIDPSVAKKEELHPNKFLEYFAKNAGIRRSIGKAILVTNADIVLTQNMTDEIKSLLDKGLSKTNFYRPHLRTQIHPEDKKLLWTDELHNPAWADSIVCGCYSGDFLLTDRNVMINVAQGYDETNDGHRHGFQNAMDGEILFQMHRKGVTLKFLESNYCHLYHSKERQYESRSYNQNGYENKKHWGFINYASLHEVPDKLEIVYAN